MVRRLGFLVLVLLLIGCSTKVAVPPPKAEPAPDARPTELEAGPPYLRADGPFLHPVNPRQVYAPFPEGAKAYFPTGDATFQWSVSTPQGAPAHSTTEYWIDDGGRITVVREGRPVWTWLIGNDGVWAPDPKNPSVLLLFLPPGPRSGMAWRQESGSDFVYFRLLAAPATNKSEWQLTVLNRGERFDYWFNPLLNRMTEQTKTGPVQWYGGRQTDSVPAEERGRILAAAPPLPTTKGAPIEIGLSDFTSYLVNLPGIRREIRDLDGDGLNEQIVGALGNWSATPIELYGPDGRFLRALNSFGLYRAELVQLDRTPRLFLSTAGELQVHWFERKGNDWQSAQAMEIGPKLVGWTSATRYRPLSDGRFEVEWEPGDPAGHRRVRTFQFGPDGKINQLGDRWEAVDGALRVPKSPLAALDGLIFALWYGQPTAEAAGYLADRTIPPALLSLSSQIPNRFDWVDVHFGSVNPSEKGGCEPLRGPEPSPDKWSEMQSFVVQIGQYEGATVLAGRASFRQEPDGRVLVQALTIEGNCGYH
jgi:hypothetical protein